MKHDVKLRNKNHDSVVYLSNTKDADVKIENRNDLNIDIGGTIFIGNVRLDNHNTMDVYLADERLDATINDSQIYNIQINDPETFVDVLDEIYNTDVIIDTRTIYGNATVAGTNRHWALIMSSNFYLLSNVSDLYIIEPWNFKSNWYLLFGADTMVEKYLGLDGTFYLSFNASELDRYILLGSVDFDMVFSSTATTNLVRLRLLSDMDGDTLSVYDGMDLSEVAIITIG